MEKYGPFRNHRDALLISKKVRDEKPIVIAALNLRYHRQVKKLSIREAAQMCSMAVGTYVSLEKGSPDSCAGNLLRALGALDVDLQKAFVCLDIPQGGVITEIVNGKARRRFPETNSVWLRSRGIVP